MVGLPSSDACRRVPVAEREDESGALVLEPHRDELQHVEGYFAFLPSPHRALPRERLHAQREVCVYAVDLDRRFTSKDDTTFGKSDPEPSADCVNDRDLRLALDHGITRVGIGRH